MIEIMVKNTPIKTLSRNETLSPKTGKIII
jgi:hypothetical protein